jgi:CRP-like cAMP-binding protein
MDYTIHTIKNNLDPFSNPPSKRTPEDIENIMRLTSKVQFFNKIMDDKGVVVNNQIANEKKLDCIHREACKYFRVQVFQRGDCVIRFGETGDEFFIVLKGKLGVYVPSKVIKSKNTYTEQELLAALSKRTSDLQARFISGITQAEEALKLMFEAELSKNLHVLKLPESKIDLKFLKKTGYIEEMKETSLLKEQDVFGDLVLINNKPRDSTVICKELCVLISLTKEEFTKILNKENQRILEEKAGFIQTIPLFSSIPKGSLLKLAYYFNEIQYHKNQTVYKAGDPADWVYFIKSGEFKLAKRKAFKPKPIIGGNESPVKLGNVREVKQGIDLQYSIKSEKEIFGQEEVLENGTEREYTAVCISSHGTLYAISKTVSFI